MFLSAVYSLNCLFHYINILRLRLHFNYVTKVISNVSVGSNAESRSRTLAWLKSYALNGVFPCNTSSKKHTPIFVDDNGVHCAVGELLKNAGFKDLVSRIKTENNMIYIKDIDCRYFEIGLRELGISKKEAKLIQPSYPPNILQVFACGTPPLISILTLSWQVSIIIFCILYTLPKIFFKKVWNVKYSLVVFLCLFSFSAVLFKFCLGLSCVIFSGGSYSSPKISLAFNFNSYTLYLCFIHILQWLSIFFSIVFAIIVYRHTIIAKKYFSIFSYLNFLVLAFFSVNFSLKTSYIGIEDYILLTVVLFSLSIHLYYLFSSKVGFGSIKSGYDKFLFVFLFIFAGYSYYSTRLSNHSWVKSHNTQDVFFNSATAMKGLDPRYSSADYKDSIVSFKEGSCFFVDKKLIKLPGKYYPYFRNYIN